MQIGTTWVGLRRPGLCPYDTIESMGRNLAVAAIVLSSMSAGLLAQAADEPVAVFAEHPRLLLRPQRLRLLKRERERSSLRWQRFAALVAGGAPLEEQGFAWALYYRIEGDAEFGKKAIEFALSPAADTRQQAIVFDWCQDLLTQPQSRTLTARLEKAITDPPGNDTAASVRARVLAAIALYDHAPNAPQRELERVVRQWWNGRVIPALKSGKHVIARDDAYPLWELMHALRDTTNIDLRESYARFFKDFPTEHLISHYPAIYPAPENEYRIGAAVKIGEPDLRAAALSRASELAMVAMDVNAPESQVLQGWLMHDKFILKSTFGAPYEFLWANPYQPGLSYYLVPLVYHDADFGRLFVRSSWDPDAMWFGDFDGTMQMFSDGRVSPVNAQLNAAPISLQEAWICFAQRTRQWRLAVDEEEAVFLLGLQPRRTYQVEVDDEEMFEAVADAGGILIVDLPKGKTIGFRIKEAVGVGQAVSPASQAR